MDYIMLLRVSSSEVGIMARLKRHPGRYDALQNLIRVEMAVQEMTVTDLADRIGLSRQTVADTLKHPEKMTLERMVKIVTVLRIPEENVRASLPVK